MIIYECVNDIGNKLVYDFNPFYEVLIEVIPPMKLPMKMGSIGGFNYFELHLTNNNITSYGELREGVFQCLREVGNTLAYLQLLESVMTKSQDLVFLHQAFYQGIIVPEPKYKGKEDPKQALKPFIFDVYKESQSKFTDIIYNTMTRLNEVGYANQSKTDQQVVNDILTLSQRCMDLYAYDSEKKSIFRKA